MHVHDTAHSRFPGGVLVPGSARQGKGLLWPPKAIWSCCDEPQRTPCAPKPPWAPRAQPRGRAAVPWCATVLWTWHRHEFIFAVSQHRERMSFSQFHRLGSKAGKGKLKHPWVWGQCNQACQRFLIFQSFTMVFSTLQVSWASPATVQVYRLVPWVSSQIPRIWGTLKLVTTHEGLGLSNLPGITLAEALKVLIP